MDTLIQVLRAASIYTVLAAGFVVVYRTSRVLNIAHAGLVLLAGYLGLKLFGLATVGFEVSTVRYLALVTVLVVACAALSAVVYYVFVRPLYGEQRISIIMMTLVVLFLAEGLSTFLFQGKITYLPMPGRGEGFALGETRVLLADVATVSVAVLVVAGLALFYQRSAHGGRMRAVAENPGLGGYRGIDVDRICALSWVIAGVLAAVGAIVLGMHNPVGPLTVGITIKAFAVSLVAGLDSLKALFPAALLIATAEVAVIEWVNPQLAEAVPFVLLLVVLVIRPWGLAGTVEELERV